MIYGSKQQEWDKFKSYSNTNKSKVIPVMKLSLIKDDGLLKRLPIFPHIWDEVKIHAITSEPKDV